MQIIYYSGETTSYLSTRENAKQTELNNEVLENVDRLEYLGSLIAKGGTIDRDVYLRMQVECSRRCKVTGVLYDQNMQLRLKSSVYESMNRSA